MGTLTSCKNNDYETKSYHQFIPQSFDLLKEVCNKTHVRAKLVSNLKSLKI